MHSNILTAFLEMLLTATKSNLISVQVLEKMIEYGANPKYTTIGNEENALFRALQPEDKEWSFEVFSLFYRAVRVTETVC